MTRPLNPKLLASGNPGLDADPEAFHRGLAFGAIISIPLWCAIGWGLERLVTWWMA